MVELYPVWEENWTNSSGIFSETLEHGDSVTSEVIDNDGVLGTELSVWCNYGSGNPLDSGCEVRILRDIDGTNFETEADVPYGLTMPIGYEETDFNPATPSQRVQNIFVDSRRVSKFKVHVRNRTGDDLTVHLSYKSVSLQKENSE